MVVEVATGLKFWVVKSFRHAFICWQALDLEGGAVRYDVSVNKLVWRCCFDEHAFKVVPTSPLSPLHMLLMNIGRSHGVLFRVLGPPKGLVEYQAELGFPGVEETTLKSLCEAQEVEEPDSTQLTSSLKAHRWGPEQS